MALESKPLFHPEVIRQQLRPFNLPERVEDWQPKLRHWASLIASGRADDFKETAPQQDFLTDIFCRLLGYTCPAARRTPSSFPANGTSRWTASSPMPCRAASSRTRSNSSPSSKAKATCYCLSVSNHAFAAVKAGITQPEWSAPGMGSIGGISDAPCARKLL